MLLRHPTDFWSSTGKAQAPAAGVCLQMFPAGRRFQSPGAAPGHPAPPPPASHGARGSHPQVRSEARTLRHRLPRGWLSLLSDPRGQELSFLPGTRTRWERLSSPMAVRVSQPSRQQHSPMSCAAAANLLTAAHPGSFLQRAMAAGESRNRAVIYDAAPNIAEDPVFCSGIS